MGHTHEDIDAGFSRISEVLRQSEAQTLPELKALIPDCHQVKGLLDVRSWLEPHLNAISHHSKPLHFKFHKQDQFIKVLYKGNYNQNWLVTTDPLLNSLPKDRPHLILPNYDHIDCDRLKKCVQNWKILFSKTDVHTLWWNTFLKQIKDMKIVPSKLKSYASADNIWILPKWPKQINSNISNLPSDFIPEELKRLLQSESDTPQVITKKRKAVLTKNVTSVQKRKKDCGSKKTTKKIAEKGKKRFLTQNKKKVVSQKSILQSLTITFAHINFNILQKIWYFTVILSYLNYIGAKSCEEKVLEKEVWKKVMHLHIGGVSCASH